MIYIDDDFVIFMSKTQVFKNVFVFAHISIKTIFNERILDKYLMHPIYR